MFKVLQGERPDRPPSGFSDQLWELLVTTWRTEQGSQSPKRPPTSTILDRLEEDVRWWGKSIIPPTPIHPQKKRKWPMCLRSSVVDLRLYTVEGTDTITSRFEGDGMFHS